MNSIQIQVQNQIFFHFIYVPILCFASLIELSCIIHQEKHQHIIRFFPFLHLPHKPTPVYSKFEQALKFICSPSILIADLSDQKQIKADKYLSLLTGLPVSVSLLSHPSLSSQVFLRTNI